MPALLHQLMLESAAATPDQEAVHTAKLSLTYAELATRAGQVAAQLLACGAKPGDRIALLVDKNADCYAGIYGILMAGCAYVPLDRRAPADRLAYILTDCEVKIVVSTEKGLQAAAKNPELLQSVADVLLLDADEAATVGAARIHGAAAIAARDAIDPVHIVDTDLAYILYTSGSTGQPKGVMISHAVSMSFVCWAGDEAGVRAGDHVSGHAPLYFDLSIFDIYATSRAGATLYPVPDGTSTFPSRLTDWMINNEINVWYSVPSILSMMAKQKGYSEREFPNLRVLIFAGEVFPAKYLKIWRAQLPGVKFMNWFGPTETNVITSHTVDVPAEAIDKPVPIGKITGNAALFRLDADGKVIDDPDVVGELYARGPCVAVGYWGDEKKTKERFVENRWQPWLRDRVYATGDLVSLDADGNFIYQGRVDHQVKVRGYRIELGEVETALYRDKSVQEAAVIPVPDDTIGNRLYAFIASPDYKDEVPDGVIDNIRQFLPNYMVPDRFIVMDELPKTSNGKIHRQTLTENAVNLS